MSVQNIYHIPPMEGSARFSPQKISGTGAVEAHNEIALSPGRTAVLSIGAVPVIVSFRKEAGLANQVSLTTSLRLPANSLFPFRTLTGTDYGSIYVYVEAFDGASAYTVDVWQASE